MNKLEKYKVFEAKNKVNWSEKLTNKLKEFKQLVDDNSVFDGIDNNEFLQTILIDLNDYGNFTYYESLFIIGKERYIVNLTENGNIITTQYAYSEYSKLTRFIDKNRFEKMEFYYEIFIRLNSGSNDEILNEINKKKEIFKSIGFIIDNYFKHDIKCKIKLENIDINLKTIDLSDLVSPNIVDDFEKFIINKNLSRKDAEEIAKIFSENK